MKLQMLTIAIVSSCFAAAAVARDHQPMLPSVVVTAKSIQACTPPAYAPSCEGFHRLIRANFSDREIRMLFGHSSTFPEYLTGGIDRLHKRYDGLVQEYIAAQQAANTTELVAK
ncbi:hypothetical protein [Rhodanobacter lindaniclasticus]